MEADEQQSGGKPAPLLSLEPEPAAPTIKRFSIVDSSDDDEYEIPDNANIAGADTGLENRFDRSKLDWSQLLEESSDATPTPPPPLRAKTALAAQRSASGAPADVKVGAAAATPGAAAMSRPVSSLGQVMLMDSDGSVDGAASGGVATPRPSRRARTGPAATPLSLIPQSPIDVSAASPLLAQPSLAVVVSPTETVNESTITARSAMSSHREKNAALLFRMSKKEPSATTATAPSAVPAAPAAAAATTATANASAVPDAAPAPLLPAAASAPSAVNATPASKPAATRTIRQRPAALKKPQQPQDGATASVTTIPNPTSAAPASVPAAELIPLSPGVVYTTVPRWTKDMKKKNGVYVHSSVVANPVGIYERGLKGLKRAEERREELRAKLEEAERSTTTFHPVISPRAHALRRSARRDGDAADLDVSTHQLRHRLQLLELPEVAEAAMRRYSPRISPRSQRIVRECRERGGIAAAMAPGDRLYQDFFYRQQALEEARRQPPPHMPPPAPVRSQRDIAAHISALYEFEKHRRDAIARAREAPLPVSPRAPLQMYVDPASLVRRLTRETTPSPRRVARALQLRSDECTFHPAANANATALAKAAQLRGIRRWVGYFGGSAVLPLAALLDYAGPAGAEAQCLAAWLSKCDPAKMEWTVEELAEVVVDSCNDTVSQLWRRRPPGWAGCGGNGNGSSSGSEFTFHPTLNVNSAALVESMEAEHRCGPAHDRLFLAAKSRQLTQKQQALEAEEAALEEQQRIQAKKEKMQAKWRAKVRQRLEAYREEKTQQCRESLLLLQDNPPQQSTQRTSRRLLLPSTSPKATKDKKMAAVAVTAAAIAGQTSPPPPTPAATTASTTKHVPASTSRASCPEAKCGSPELSPTPPPSPPRSPAAPPTGVKSVNRKDEKRLKGSATLPLPTAPPAQPTTVKKDVHTESTDIPARRDSQDLSSAAEALRQLLGGTAHSSMLPSHHSEATTTAVSTTSAPSPARATPIMPRDINRAREGKSICRSLDVVLECAALRDPATVSGVERGQLERAQRRQLRELGRLLYSRNRARVEGK